MAIWSVPFDPRSGRATGKPRLVPTPTEWAGPFSISAGDESIAYTSRSAHGRIRHIPVDPSAGPPAETAMENHVIRGGFTISNDGDSIVFQGGDLLREDIYISNLDGSDMRQLTNDLHFDRSPAYSPDDEWVIFNSNRSGEYQAWAHELIPRGRPHHLIPPRTLVSSQVLAELQDMFVESRKKGVKRRARISRAVELQQHGHKKIPR